MASDLISSLQPYEKRLYAGKYSMIGFLTPKQKLSEVITDDLQIAHRHNVSLRQVGCVLERFVLLRNQRTERVDDTYEVSSKNMTKGYQTCPFGKLDAEECKYGNGTVCVKKIATGEEFRFEALLAHLVKEHSFCEGPGTPYRLDLEGAIRFFGIQPGVDYTPRFEPVSEWVCGGFRTGSCPDPETIPFALATYTNKYFSVLVCPDRPHRFSMTKYSPENGIENWRLALTQQEEEENASTAKAYEQGERLLKGVRVLSADEIVAKVDAEMALIQRRASNFEAGIIEDDICLLIMFNVEWAHPETGLALTWEEGEFRLSIPSLQFAVSIPFRAVLSSHTYTRRTYRRYI